MVLQIKKISKSFGGIKALNNCSMNIAEGKITAVIGPNGSGKSTLFNIISGIVKEDNGEIILKEKKLNGFKDFEIANMGVSRTFQEVRLFKNLTIREHLKIALSNTDDKIIKSAFFKEVETEQSIREILETIGLDKEPDSYASDLSYGQRKLLDLAVALTKQHDVLMLDEPVAGINPELRKKIKNIMIRLKKKGETIIIIEHDMNFVMDIADYIYVLDYGSVIAEGRPREIQKSRKVLEAYLGR